MEGGKCYDADIDNLTATELRLGPPGSDEIERAAPIISRGSKRASPGDSGGCQSEVGSVENACNTAPVAKAQVVGWPPIRSYRKKSFEMTEEHETAGLYVKVRMDGAPYLRKIDLMVCRGYKELRVALNDLFNCFNQDELSECKGSHGYAITYEDKDGDWMLVGDVPWGMFIYSCKRLSITKRSEARGLTSRT